MNPNISIRSIMTTDLVTFRPEETAAIVRSLFEKYDFHHLPVVERGGQLSGIISKEDFHKISYVLSLDTTGKAWTKLEYNSLKAKDIMTKYPIQLEPDDDTIGLAADIFLANKFHSLPVVEDGQLVGIVTTHDLLAHIFSSAVEPSFTEEFKE